MSSRSFPWLFAALLAAPVAHAQPAGPQALTPEAAVAAAGNYQRYCALCHGDKRQGHVNDHAPSLRSPSLIASAFPYLLRDAIGYGRHGTAMGAYLDELGGPMTRQEVREMTLWLREVADVEPVEIGPEIVAGDAGAGEAVYQANCAECHGAEGEGGTGTALGNATMLALSPDAFLRHAIVHGREGTPMPAFAGTLSESEIDNVTAFLRSRSTGWSVTSRTLRTPPALDAAVINPDGQAPSFELREGRYVSAAQLDRELKAKRRMVLLDTRVTSMWQLAHLEGSVPLPYYADRNAVAGSLPRDGTWIVAYCECPRAAADSVVRWLREDGFENTAVLYEGIQGWVALGYPVTAGDASVVATD
jgi:mono/diheme cytochrome c family protein/rhodanese-related sulfurtransferase